MNDSQTSNTSSKNSSAPSTNEPRGNGPSSLGPIIQSQLSRLLRWATEPQQLAALAGFIVEAVRSVRKRRNDPGAGSAPAHGIPDKPPAGLANATTDPGAASTTSDAAEGSSEPASGTSAGSETTRANAAPGLPDISTQFSNRRND